jgi:chromosome segregation ATPase
MKSRFFYSTLIAAGLAMALPASLFGQRAGGRGGLPPSPGSSGSSGPDPALVQARKEIQLANEDVVKAQKDLNKIRTRVAATFETKDEWKAAKDALKQAQTEYDKIKKANLAAMKAKPEYKALLAKRDAAQAVFDAASAGGDTEKKITDEELNKATDDRQKSALGLRKMEEDSLENDSAYIAARDKLKDAKEAWDALQTQVTDAMKSDPEYAAVQQALDQAKDRVKQLRQQLADNAKARREQELQAERSRSQERASSSYGGR